MAEWAAQLHAWTWPYSPEQMAAVCEDVRRWALAEGVRLDEEVELLRVVQWWALDLAG